VTLADPRVIKAEYERRATALLQDGFLGHGVHEDLLLQAAWWFDRPLAPGAGALADFFRAALDNHVVLYFAVAPRSSAAAADLHDFLQVVLYWLRALPDSLLKKSPEPLGLVVSEVGDGQRLGAQVMRWRGPSLIYWGAFQALRPPGQGEYWGLADQVRRTLIHELVGHQLAFCSSAGPLLPREDLRDILKASDIRHLKVIDGPPLDVETFLVQEDLLEAVRRIHYFSGRYNEQKYYSNLAELIAFAAEGSSPGADLPHAAVHAILKRNLLRLPNPLTAPGPDGATLYEGYDVAQAGFPRYFIEHIDGAWVETGALRHGDRWLTLRALARAARAHKEDLAAAPLREWIEPGQVFHLQVPFGGYLLEIHGSQYLVCPFGMFGDLAGDTPRPWLLPIRQGDVAIQPVVRNAWPWGGFAIRNDSEVPILFKLLELKAASPCIQSEDISTNLGLSSSRWRGG
jgi:hypothetical protein